jgi:hypothetical protein
VKDDVRVVKVDNIRSRATMDGFWIRPVRTGGEGEGPRAGLSEPDCETGLGDVCVVVDSSTGEVDETMGGWSVGFAAVEAPG